jgi:hypothetical protein
MRRGNFSLGTTISHSFSCLIISLKGLTGETKSKSNFFLSLLQSAKFICSLTKLEMDFTLHPILPMQVPAGSISNPSLMAFSPFLTIILLTSPGKRKIL